MGYVLKQAGCDIRANLVLVESYAATFTLPRSRRLERVERSSRSAYLIQK